MLLHKNKRLRSAYLCSGFLILIFFVFSGYRLLAHIYRDTQRSNTCDTVWLGLHTPDPARRILTVHVVVAYCKAPLRWLTQEMEKIQAHPHITVTQVLVFTKCGLQPRAAPPGAILKTLDNVGRCDHTYAYHMSDLIRKESTLDPDVVLYLKDTRLIHQQAKFSPLHTMILQAGSEVGFACGLIPSIRYADYLTYGSFSAWHHTETLLTLKKTSYVNKYRDGTSSQKEPFQSHMHNMKDWMETSLKMEPPTQTIVPVCYGGMFATNARRIRQHEAELFDRLVSSLSRGDNVEEGHYAERLWATLLSAPLDNAMLENITKASQGFLDINHFGMLGALYSCKS